MTATLDTVHLDPQRQVSGVRRAGFRGVLAAEWIKFWTVRSTVWSTVAFFVLGAGLTVAVCAAVAGWLASEDASQSPVVFVNWGLGIAQIAAIALGTLIVTSEYGTGMIQATLAATPRRGAVVVAKAVVLSGTLLVVGLVTVIAGYLGGNWFLDREGVGVPLGTDGLVRALVGSGMYVAGLGLLAMGVGLVVRHTAAALSIVLALVFVVGNTTLLLPHAWGEWVARLMPSNAGSGLVSAVPTDPAMFAPWTGFAVFAAETAAVLVAGYVVLRRRDA